MTILDRPTPAPVLARGRTGRALTAAGLAVLVLASLATLLVLRLTALPADAALRVDDQEITRTDLDTRLRLYGELYGVVPPADPAGRDALRRSGARAVAVSTLVEQEAAARGVRADAGAVDAQLDRLVAGRLPGGRDELLARAGRAGISERDVRAEVGRQMSSRPVFAQVTATAATVTDAEVRQAFDQRRPTEPERRVVRVIALADRADADATATRLSAGADPAVEARRSVDRSGAERGGDLGTPTRDELDRLDPALAQAVFAAPGPGTVGPTPVGGVWVVGRVDGIRPGAPLTYEQSRDGLRTVLDEDRRAAAWQAWLDRRLAEVGVEYADDLQPTDTPAPGSPR